MKTSKKDFKSLSCHPILPVVLIMFLFLLTYTHNLLKLPRYLAPIEVAVFPLMKKNGMPERARQIYRELIKEGFIAFYDESGTIGRRYRRMDEIGTPICVTVDHQTMEDDTVTMRDRDTMKQVRVKVVDLPEKARRFLKEDIAIEDLQD